MQCKSPRFPSSPPNPTSEMLGEPSTWNDISIDIYIYVYTVYIYIHMCVRIYICIYRYMYICTYTCFYCIILIMDIYIQSSQELNAVFQNLSSNSQKLSSSHPSPLDGCRWPLKALNDPDIYRVRPPQQVGAHYLVNCWGI